MGQKILKFYDNKLDKLRNSTKNELDKIEFQRLEYNRFKLTYD